MKNCDLIYTCIHNSIDVHSFNKICQENRLYKCTLILQRNRYALLRRRLGYKIIYRSITTQFKESALENSATYYIVAICEGIKTPITIIIIIIMMMHILIYNIQTCWKRKSTPMQRLYYPIQCGTVILIYIRNCRKLVQHGAIILSFGNSQKRNRAEYIIIKHARAH